MSFDWLPWLQEGSQTLDDLKASLGAVTKKMNSVAEYFCQDSKKFKLEDLFAAVLNFLRELENAKKVSTCARTHLHTMLL